MPIGKLKKLIEDVIRIGIGEELAKLNTNIDSLVKDNQKLWQEIYEIRTHETEIYQRLSNLEGRFDNLAQDTWLKVENEILKTGLKKLLE